MRFIRVLVLLLLTVPVCSIQRNTNLIDNQFSKLSIYCRQSFVKLESSARSSVQCASYCLSLFTPYCKAFTWNEIYKICSLIDKITKIEVAVGVYVPVQSELDIYAAFKDGCTNKGYYYDFNSNTCLKMFVDSDGKTWKGARNHCQGNGGDLISLTTLAKWNFVTMFTSCVSDVWIGIKDKRWVTNDVFQNIFNAKVQFNNFDSAYTNDPEPVCVAFKYGSPVADLQDESCNIRLKQTYVCEIQV
ncbi:Hypothetical predicted protein [Mytilus galloprovincialis]|uniref:C-type lectin domain-containing protein n=1 Tax=Mytilus galloprovincialis TaxID=29158 RepID=A0A8B6BX56_MYTGA|nr:Hypothetical predicted protein [Mytilus galloprovincialis]